MSARSNSRRLQEAPGAGAIHTDGSGDVALDRTAPPAVVVWEGTIAAEHGRRDYWLRRALVGVDMLALMAALQAAFYLAGEHSASDLAWALPTLPAWVVLFSLYGLYSRGAKRIAQGTLDVLPYLFHALLIGALALWVYFRFGPPGDQLVLAEIVIFGAAGSALVLLLRAGARRGTVAILGPERALMVGEAQVTGALVRKIASHPEYALEPVGIMTGREPGASRSSLPILGGLSHTEVAAAIKRHRVERVIVAQEEVDDDLILALMQTCGQAQVKLSVLPRHVEVIGPSVEIDDIEGVTVLGLNPLVLPRSARLFKRTMDVIGASVGLVLLAPLMALAAIAVRLDSPGPVLFRQVRIGKRGEVISPLKFRTMVEGAEELGDELRAESDDPDWLKLESDPRVTRVGRVLRLASIDELPQLWTVLRGKMSLVGPRPLIPEESERVLTWARARLDLAPGITGLWQVLGRTDIPFEEMVKLDYVYVTNWSLWTDVKLLLRTLPAVARRRGAN